MSPATAYITVIQASGQGSCPPGFSLNGTSCTLPAATPDPAKDNGCHGSSMVGNPCNAGTGNKYQHETDYVGIGTYPLQADRTYNSGGSTPASVGVSVWGSQWRGNYDRSIVYSSNGTSLKTASVKRADGRTYYFNQAIGTATPPLTTTTWTPDTDVVGSLVATGVDVSGNPTGWTYHNENDEVETYNVAGELISITNYAGQIQTLTYSDNTAGTNGGYILDATGAPTAVVLPAGYLIRVTDPATRTLQFGYDATGRVVKMTDPSGGLYHYTYSGTLLTDNLSTVTYPDSKTKTYRYGETDHVVIPNAGISYAHALTSILDENGVLYANWTYDANGLAISSAHGAFNSGIDHVGLAYGTPNASGNSTTTVTDPRGNTRSYNFATLLSVVKNTGITGQPCDGCSASFTYDTNGNIASRTDFNGNTTCYAYDLTRNLEIVRLEGLAPAAGTTTPTACPANLATYVPSTATGSVERKISTQWHATLRLRTLIAEPLRTTSYIYNGTTVTCGTEANGITPVPGVLCSKTIQPTADTTGGAGLTVAASGTPRTWSYTYNAAGQVLTVDGPRTDVSDITTYHYDALGNLDTVTNALNPPTTLTSYDGNGRPGLLTDPNGLLTDLYYDPRGRLSSRVSGGEPTYYTYDGVGQLKTVTAPGGAEYLYTYDDDSTTGAAHRLTDIRDNLGNHIHYTLDKMGNRTQEQTYDSLGNLVRTHSRIFDALNHLWQDIGAINQTTTYLYDLNGNLANITVPFTSASVNQTTINTYDALNRLINTNNPDKYDTKYGYDGLDQLISVTDPKKLITNYSRDGLGNLNQLISPDTGTTRYTKYDNAGNLLIRTDAKNQTATYTYDALNRVLTTVYTGGTAPAQNVGYTYDQGVNGIGHLTQLIDSTGTTNYSYDQHGRLYTEARQIQGMTYTTVYSHDTLGRLASIGYPSGRLVSYGFDTLGRINQITTTLNGVTNILASNIIYEPFGGVHSFNFGDGVTAPVQSYLRSRDQDGRIASYALKGKTMTIGYDAASQLSSITDSSNKPYPAGYGYDSLSRLNSYTQGSTGQTYYYDADGNRSSQILGSTTGYTYVPGSNKLAGIQVNGGAIQSIVPDANGSTTSDATRQYVYGYDLRGRLVKTTTALGVINDEVNALGLRVHKQVSYASTNTLFHYDTQGHLIGESPVGSATFTREYIYLGDQPVAVLK